MGATFLWNLSKPFNISADLAYMKIYSDNINTEYIIFYSPFGCNSLSDTNLDCVDEINRVGFMIKNITDQYACKYCIELLHDASVPTPDVDCDGVLYVYRKFKLSRLPSYC